MGRWRLEQVVFLGKIVWTEVSTVLDLKVDAYIGALSKTGILATSSRDRKREYLFALAAIRPGYL